MTQTNQYEQFNQRAIASAEAVLASFAAKANQPSAPLPPTQPQVPVVPQPDANGEFVTPLDGALFMALGYGIPQTPLRGKAPFLREWQLNASTDPGQLKAWYEQFNCNFGSLAVIGSHFIFESDLPTNGTPKIRDRFKAQGGEFTSQLVIQSSPGKGHRYYLYAQGIDNIGQNATEHGDFSIRADGEQCVSPGSIHPTTQKQYRVAASKGALAAPTKQEIAFWNSEKSQKTPTAAPSELKDIPEGKRSSTLMHLAGKYLDLGEKPEIIKERISEINSERCTPPLSEQELKDTIFSSVDKYYAKGNDAITRRVTETVIMSQTEKTRAEQAAAAPVASVIEPVEIAAVPYPKFPRWVMKGTSLYEGLVKPVCDVNTRFPEFMFMPAVVLMLNYVGLKITVEGKKIVPGLFLASIGRKGQIIKSSSVNDGIEYLEAAGFVKHASGAITNAEGKSLVWTVGSPEGLGLEMARTNCKNAVLFYDELGTLTKKAHIDASTMGMNLLTLAESGKFANTIKSKRETYSFDPGTYCASIIACNTDKTFVKNMAPLLAAADGLDERFFYLYQPDPATWPKMIGYRYVNTLEGAVETRKRVIKAMEQKTFKFGDLTVLDEAVAINNRLGSKAEKLALYFAIDLGKDIIDDDCVERAVELAKYDWAVKNYLKVPEAYTKEGLLQGEIISLLMRSGGKMLWRDMDRVIHPERYGTRFWDYTWDGLVNSGWIKETGTGSKGDPKMVTLLRKPASDDDE